MEKDLEKIAREFKESLDKYWELLVKIIEHKEVEASGAVSNKAESKGEKTTCKSGKVDLDPKQRKIFTECDQTGKDVIPF